MFWEAVHPGALPDHPVGHCTRFSVAGTFLLSMHTPGPSPGSTSLYARDPPTRLTGGTLFSGGPRATGRSPSEEPAIPCAIRPGPLTLPGGTVVPTRHR